VAVDTKLTRSQAATDARLSERRVKTALRVADVPNIEFELAMESADPPTESKLADRERRRSRGRWSISKASASALRSRNRATARWMASGGASHRAAARSTAILTRWVRAF
jgi:hypothetical protein